MQSSVWEFLDGQCASEVAERISAHASVCARCLHFLGVQERFLSSLAELRERSRAPARLRERVRAAVAVARGEGERG